MTIRVVLPSGSLMAALVTSACATAWLTMFMTSDCKSSLLATGPISQPSGTPAAMRGLSRGPTTNVLPAIVPGPEPAGRVVCTTNGSWIPSRKITPGSAGRGPNRASGRLPMKAANSARSGDTPATPTPPTTWPFLKMGTPPPVTDVASVSDVSGFPVAIPSPQPRASRALHGRPLSDFDGVTAWPGLKSGVTGGDAIGQPRFVFSMPYRAAFGLFVIPGGKWTPLMKRTVRDDRGAWSLLKNDAVRASETAKSLALTVTPKFPITVAGASGFRTEAGTRPSRW